MTFLIITFFLVFSQTAFPDAENHRLSSEMNGGCESFSMSLISELEAWKVPAKGVNAGAPAEQSAEISVGQKSTLQLTDQTRVKFALKPRKSNKPLPQKYGGQVKFKTPAAGIYRVSLGAKAWVDLVEASGKNMETPLSFEKRNQCKEIFKVITFKLKGEQDYMLEISSSAEARLDLIVTPVSKM